MEDGLLSTTADNLEVLPSVRGDDLALPRATDTEKCQTDGASWCIDDSRDDLADLSDR